ncbi:proline--tRNA ligase [bacterium]|nr:proline--tRNA ligase [bacterium]
MRLSQAFLPTRKELPSDTVMPSHQLMLRAGMIQLLASGIYSYLPIGWKVIKKVIEIVREEMDRIGAQELMLPILNPIEIWDETGRNTDFGDEMFRLYDRKKRSLILAPTHEEIICDLARKYIQSYKDMPQIWYQIQTKFRDEPRPRSGLIRARQFIMKDSYSMDVDDDHLEKSYQLHAQAYKKIFHRCGLQFHIVTASSGLMGGSGSQEFMVESEYGEDTLVICSDCDYAANQEIAVSHSIKIKNKEAVSLKRLHTPGKKTIKEVSDFLGIQTSQLMKSLIYICNSQPIMVLIRGDHELNESKLLSFLSCPVRPAQPDEVKDLCNTEIGFIGPVGLKKSMRIIADLSLKDQHDLIAGANKKDFHISGIELKRDIKQKIEYSDLKIVKSGEKCKICNGKLKIVNAIELGHIFKLGTKYSKSMKAFFVDNKGHDKPIVMGSYGIGIERIVAAAILQNFDDKGIIWNEVLAPYLIHIIPIKFDNTDILEMANQLYYQLKSQQLDTIIDDRYVTPGYKFKDADLLGMPFQVIVGEKWLHDGLIEIKKRKSNEKIFVKQNEFIKTIKSLLK